jgi:hypothetical protein
MVSAQKKGEQMNRLTEKTKYGTCIPLRKGTGPHWSLNGLADADRWLYGEAAERLAAYEAVGLEPNEVEILMVANGEMAAQITKLAVERDGYKLAHETGQTLISEKNAEIADLLQKTQQLEARLGEAGEVANQTVEFIDLIDCDTERELLFNYPEGNALLDKLRRIAGV